MVVQQQKQREKEDEEAADAGAENSDEAVPLPRPVNRFTAAALGLFGPVVAKPPPSDDESVPQEQHAMDEDDHNLEEEDDAMDEDHPPSRRSLSALAQDEFEQPPEEDENMSNDERNGRPAPVRIALFCIGDGLFIVSRSSRS